MKAQNWWPLALSEAVSGAKPIGVVCNGEHIVLFRNAAGEACALEDRCPHRRVPLSLGIVKEGRLQCAYHGWTFDGASGACTAIPNLHADEAVPARYGVRAYPVTESHGFIHVWLAAGAPDTPVPSADYLPTSAEFTGSATVNMAHAEYLAAMLDGPECLLAFDAVRITDFFLGDARQEGDRMVLDRGAVWKRQWQPSQFVIDYPLIVRTSVPLAGGTVRVDLLDANETAIITVFIGSGANRRGTTSLCWRGYVASADITGASLRWHLARRLQRPPFSVFTAIDGAAVASLLVGPYRDFDALRSQKIIPLTLVG